MKKFCVVVNDDGSFMAGEEPQGEPDEPIEGMEDEAAEDSYLQPVEGEEGVMQALESFLAGAADPEGMAEAENEAAFEGGFKGASGVTGMEGLM